MYFGNGLELGRLELSSRLSYGKLIFLLNWKLTWSSHYCPVSVKILTVFSWL